MMRSPGREAHIDGGGDGGGDGDGIRIGGFFLIASFLERENGIEGEGRNGVAVTLLNADSAVVCALCVWKKGKLSKCIPPH